MLSDSRRVFSSSAGPQRGGGLPDGERRQRWPEGQEGARRNRAMPGTRTALQHSTKSNSKTC